MIKPWSIFMIERFNPLVYGVTISVFFTAHYLLYLHIDPTAHLSYFDLTLLFLGVILFFFKLRLLDEIKDHEHDIRNYPDRPLPREILSLTHIKTAVTVVLIFEAAIFFIFGLHTLIAFAISSLYVYAMAREFFVKDWIRSRLTLYAVTHTLSVIILSLVIFSALSTDFFWNLPLETLSFSVAGWFIFNIFEFSRKTFASDEERTGVDSYSKNWGRFGALALTLLCALLGGFLITTAVPATNEVILHLWSLGVLFLLGGLYVLSDKIFYAKIYRAYASFFILLIYGITILPHL